jgi:hypothetical protein
MFAFAGSEVTISGLEVVAAYVAIVVPWLYLGPPLVIRPLLLAI